MYTKYYTNQKGPKPTKEPSNCSIFSFKTNRTKSGPKTINKTNPRVKTVSSNQKPQIPRNDLMFNIAMNNMVKFQDAMVTKHTIPTCLSMSNIEDKKNEEEDLNDSNELIEQAYEPEPLPEKSNDNINEQTANYQNVVNNRKLLYTLRTLDLENLFIAFNLNSITFNDLFLLSKDDLLEMKIPLGPRNRLLHFADEYKKIAKDYDYKELTDFFQRNKCFLINQVQDFSCPNVSGTQKSVGKNIILTPKGNSRQPNNKNNNNNNSNNHNASLHNVSVNNISSNNLREDIDNIQDINPKSNRLLNNTFNYYNIRQGEKESEPDKDSINSNFSLLKGLSCANSQQNTISHYENNAMSSKKNNINNFFYQNYSNTNNEICFKPKPVKDQEERESRKPPQKYSCPIPSLNHSAASAHNNNYNQNTIQIQTVPLTIANIEEPQQIGNQYENSPNNSITYYDDKISIPNKSDLSTSSTSKNLTTMKTKKVEQFQHQYESMKQKNDQRKTKLHTLLKKKEPETQKQVNYTQPKNHHISLGKEDLYNESERNLNDELSKLYDSEMKTNSNTSIQQHRYYGTNSNKETNSRTLYDSDFQTLK